MDTTYGLIKTVGGIKNGNKEGNLDLIKLSVDDMFFQMQYIVCSDELIGGELKDLYVYIAKNLFLLETPDKAADFLNDTVMSRTARWLSKNRPDIINAEKQGLYPVPEVQEAFTNALEIEEVDLTNVLIRELCVIPEIHRLAALAFFYNNMDYERMSENLMTPIDTLKTRIAFVEKTLSKKAHEFCQANNLKCKPINAQRIRNALVELGKLYKYNNTDILLGEVADKIK